MYIYLLQNGALWNTGLVHCGICSNNGLAPNRPQTITWTSDGFFYWRHGLDELVLFKVRLIEIKHEIYEFRRAQETPYDAQYVL